MYIFNCIPGIILGSHIFLIILNAILLASQYHLLQINFSDLPLNLQKDSTKLRTDAWWYVTRDNSVAADPGTQKTRSMQYQTITMVYELKGGNLFTKENLLAIKRNEDELFNNNDYQKKLCQLQGNSTCKPLLSILRFFDGTYRQINNNLYDPEFKNIFSVLHAAQSMKLSKAILDFHLSKDATVEKDTASSSHTRSLIYTGWPVKGFSSTKDRDDDQVEKIDQILIDIFGRKLQKTHKDGVKDINFYYDNKALKQEAIHNQVLLDMLLAIASFVFMFLFMWLQTESLWLTVWGVFSILSSFNIAVLIYRVVFDYRYIGIFHILSIFIILGIGSDDIFVFMDTWKQSRSQSFKTLADRLSSVFRRAAKATLLTSFTTMTAFLSNAWSPILVVSSFGLFSALLIAVNYISVITFFPTVIIFHHQMNRRELFCGVPISSGATDKHGTVEENEAQPQGERRTNNNLSKYIIQFFEGWFFRNIVNHKVVRWLVMIFFMALTATSISFATQLQPFKDQVRKC